MHSEADMSTDAQRICIIGNSQVATWHTAIKQNYSDTSNLQFTVLSKAGGSGPRIHLKGSKFSASRFRRSFFGGMDENEIVDGNECVDLSSFDVCVYVGLGARALRRKYAPSLIEYTHAVTGIRGLEVDRKVDNLVSKSILDTIVRKDVLSQPSLQTIKTIRSVFTGPIFLHQYPLPSADFLDSLDDISFYDSSSRYLLSYRYKLVSCVLDSELSSLSISKLGEDPEWIGNGVVPLKYAGIDVWHPKIGPVVLSELVDAVG